MKTYMQKQKVYEWLLQVVGSNWLQWHKRNLYRLWSCSISWFCCSFMSMLVNIYQVLYFKLTHWSIFQRSWEIPCNKILNILKLSTLYIILLLGNIMVYFCHKNSMLIKKCKWIRIYALFRADVTILILA